MSEDFKESVEKEPIDFTYQQSQPKSKRSPSLFGPIVLISIGIFFLLVNLGVIEDYSFNWAGILQLWPLFLILIGLNIIVKQATQPLGGVLSALVGFAAILVFGYVLFFGEDNAIINRFGIMSSPAEYTLEEINYAPANIETADVDLNFGVEGVDIAALEDSNSLIAGQVYYLEQLTFETDTSGSHANVFLDERGQSWFWLNPANWASGNTEKTRWDLGLNPDVAIDLRLDSGAGSVNYDLAGLTLSQLQIDASAGSATVTLPNGTYDVDYDQSAGSLRMTLPEIGQQKIKIDGSAGSIRLFLPTNMAALVEVDKGAGSLNLGPRFIQLEGDVNDDSIWATEDFDNAENRVQLNIDMGAGSFTIAEP